MKRIYGDMRLLISTLMAASIIVVSALLSIYYIWVNIYTPIFDKQMATLFAICLCVTGIGIAWVCINKYLVWYDFDDEKITIAHGIKQHRLEYPSKAYKHVELFVDRNLSINCSRIDSMILVISPRHFSGSEKQRLSSVRSARDMIVIRLNKKSLTALQELIECFPTAPYTQPIKRYLGSLSCQ